MIKHLLAVCIIVCTTTVSGQDLIGSGIMSMLSLLNKKNKELPPYNTTIGYTITKEKKKTSFQKIRQLNRTILEYPDSAFLFVDRGMELKWLTVYKDALRNFEKAVELKSENPELRFYLGECHFFLGHRKSALFYFDEYKELYPDSVKSYFYKGLVRMYLQKSRLHSVKERFQESIPEFNQALTVAPDHEGSLLLRGYAYHYLKNYDAAINDYKKILSNDPGNLNMHLFLGQVYYEQEKHEMACAQFEMVKNQNRSIKNYIKKACNK